MDESILITGKTGFIGQHLSGKEFVGDICNPEDVKRNVKNVRGIVHLAAISNNYECEKAPLKCIHTNFYGTFNILEAIKGKNIWLLYVSTFQVKEPTLYGLSKLMAEELCRLYSSWITTKIIRLPVVYGENDKSYKLVTRLINDIKNNKKIVLPEDNEIKLAYVKDVANMIKNEMSLFLYGSGVKMKTSDLIETIKKCLKSQ